MRLMNHDPRIRQAITFPLCPCAQQNGSGARSLTYAKSTNIWLDKLHCTMQFIKPDVSTFCIGQAASAGAILLCAGAQGKRYCLPNSRVMIHQPHGGAQGQATDVEIQTREMLLIREKINIIMA